MSDDVKPYRANPESFKRQMEVFDRMRDIERRFREELEACDRSQRHEMSFIDGVLMA